MKLWYLLMVGVAQADWCGDIKVDDSSCGNSEAERAACCVELCNEARCACENVSPDVIPGPGCYGTVSGGAIIWASPRIECNPDVNGDPMECSGTCWGFPAEPYATCDRYNDGVPPPCDPP